MRKCIVYSLGLLDYELVWKYQRLLAAKIHKQKLLQSNNNDFLIFTQHPSIYTLGRGGSTSNLKFIPSIIDPNRKVFRVERGGEITW